MALVSFKNDIQPLFRARDVQCMAGAVDLNSYDDVKAKADEIYARLTTTDPGAVMPPDGIVTLAKNSGIWRGPVPHWSSPSH